MSSGSNDGNISVIGLETGLEMDKNLIKTFSNHDVLKLREKAFENHVMYEERNTLLAMCFLLQQTSLQLTNRQITVF